MAGVGPQAEQAELDSYEALVEATHPFRGLLMRRLKQPRTAAGLAEVMQVPVTRLYHHLNRLTEVGLIRVVATRRVGSATERRYQLVARSFTMSETLAGEVSRDEVGKAVASVFDLAKIGFQRSLELADGGSAEICDDAHVGSLVSLHESRLDDAELRGLHAELQAVLDKYREIGRRNEETPVDHSPDPATVFVAVFREPD